MESVPLCFRIIRGGDLLGLRVGGGSQSVGETPAFQNKLEAEGRKRGKGMIMKNFKASLLFVLSSDRRRRRAERGRGGREMLEEELTSRGALLQDK